MCYATDPAFSFFTLVGILCMQSAILFQKIQPVPNIATPQQDSDYTGPFPSHQSSGSASLLETSFIPHSRYHNASKLTSTHFDPLGTALIAILHSITKLLSSNPYCMSSSWLWTLAKHSIQSATPCYFKRSLCSIFQMQTFSRTEGSERAMVVLHRRYWVSLLALYRPKGLQFV